MAGTKCKLNPVVRSRVWSGDEINISWGAIHMSHRETTPTTRLTAGAGTSDQAPRDDDALVDENTLRFILVRVSSAQNQSNTNDDPG